MIREINFDMDGTIADLYGVENWLDDLINERTRPYEMARVLINMSALARQIHRVQRIGYKVNIISWLSKSGTEEYNARVTQAKLEWLAEHLPSVEFDNISIVPYGTPKETLGVGYLFDDELRNRENWIGVAYDVDNILEIMRAFE